MAELPIACTLTRDELQARRDDLIPGLVARATEVEFLPNGLAARFEPAPDLLAHIARVVDAERQCCRFFRFQWVVEPDFGPIRLEITGPEGTSELLRSLASPASHEPHP